MDRVNELAKEELYFATKHVICVQEIHIASIQSMGHRIVRETFGIRQEQGMYS